MWSWFIQSFFVKRKGNFAESCNNRYIYPMSCMIRNFPSPIYNQAILILVFQERRWHKFQKKRNGAIEDVCIIPRRITECHWSNSNVNSLNEYSEKSSKENSWNIFFLVYLHHQDFFFLVTEIRWFSIIVLKSHFQLLGLIIMISYLIQKHSSLVYDQQNYEMSG